MLTSIPMGPQYPFSSQPSPASPTTDSSASHLQTWLFCARVSHMCASTNTELLHWVKRIATSRHFAWSYLPSTLWPTSTACKLNHWSHLQLTSTSVCLSVWRRVQASATSQSASTHTSTSAPNARHFTFKGLEYICRKLWRLAMTWSGENWRMKWMSNKWRQKK